MKSVVRFAEYSLTGGLLWVNLAIFVTLLALPEASLGSAVRVWQAWLEDLDQWLQPIQNSPLLEDTLNTLLAALGIILIFCTGLLLDLVSPQFCIPFQMLFLKRQLSREQHHWFAKLAHDNRDFLLDDYCQFLQQPLFKLSDYRQWFTQRHRFLRIQAFTQAYLFVFSSNSQIEPLMDQFRIWNISRSLFTSLVLLSALLGFVAIFGNIGHATGLAFWLGIGIPLALTGLAYLSAQAVFARLSNNVLAIAYHTYRLQQQPPPLLIERLKSPA